LRVDESKACATCGFSRGFQRTGDAPPFGPSVFRRERFNKGFRGIFPDVPESRESEL